MFAKMRRFWKVRAMPSRALSAGESSVTSSPPSQTRPPDGRCSRLMALNSVVLPAPFGPMRATICPPRTAMETSLTARSPPKSTETSSIRSSSSPLPAAAPLRSAKRAPGAPSSCAVARVLRHVDRQRHLRLAGSCGPIGLCHRGALERLGPALPAERVLDAHQPLLREQPGDAHGQEQEQKDHDDRVDDAAPLLGAGERVGEPGHQDRRRPDRPRWTRRRRSAS